MRNTLIALVLSAAAIAVGARADAQPRRRFHVQAVVRVPPPMPLVEVVPPPPDPQLVWIDGHWRWDGYQYRWVAGYFARPPRAQLVWVPSGWARVRAGYRYAPGRWVLRDRIPRARVLLYPPAPRRYGPRYEAIPSRNLPGMYERPRRRHVYGP